jgi:hypothetical protein
MEKMSKQSEDRLERMAAVNILIRVISRHGRRFFRHEERVSKIERFSTGRLYFVDCWSQKAIDLHAPNARWGGKFAGGGTLRCLVKALKDYIWTGKQLHFLTFGPWENHPDEKGGLWGYGADMENVRQAARDLGILATEEAS